MSSIDALKLDELELINIHEAKTHLSALIDQVVAGVPFIIAKSGKPQAVVYAYQDLTVPKKRTGFMPDLVVPDDFDTYMREEIAEMFGVAE